MRNSSNEEMLNKIVTVLGIFFICYATYFLAGLLINSKILTEFDLFSFSVRYYREAYEHHLKNFIPSMSLHVFAGILLLGLGFVQINRKIRQNAPKFHKLSGYLYFLVGCLAAGGGIFIAHRTVGGVVAQLGFYCAGAVWFLSAFKALQSIYQRNFRLHQAWTYRNFIVGASTGLMRPSMLIFDKIFPGSSPGEIFTIGIWFSLFCALVLWLMFSEPKKI